MEDQNQFNSAKKLIETAQSFIIALPSDPGKDLVSAGLSLHLSLKSSGKKSQIGCGSRVEVDESVIGAQEIADSIGARNLVISFDYHEDDLEKVDYDVRPDGKFYLMIKPKSNAPVPDAGNVKYSYSGAQADLVITLGINSLEELGKIYADEKNFLDNAKILSLNITPRPVQFTQNVINQTFGSFSELIGLLIERTNLKIDPNASKNLLCALYEETKNLTSPKMTADTFSVISYLMRHGARLPNQQSFVPRFAQPAFFEAPSAPKLPMPAEEEIPLPPEPEEESLPSPEDSQIPQDWTKPKIFRASDL